MPDADLLELEPEYEAIRFSSLRSEGTRTFQVGTEYGTLSIHADVA